MSGSKVPAYVPPHVRRGTHPPAPAPTSTAGPEATADAALDAMEAGEPWPPAAGTPALRPAPAPPPCPVGSLAPAPSCIRPGVYLGGLAQARDLETLSALGITHVVNVTEDCPFYAPERLVGRRVPVADDGRATLAPVFAPVAAFIDGALAAGGKVLLHCRYGVSRSATLAVAYLMQTEGLAASAAIDAVRAARPQIWPNPTFLHELMRFGRDPR